MGLDLDKSFNAHNDKTREGQRGTCIACAHDITKNHRRRNRNLQKGIPGNPVRGTTGHNRLCLNSGLIFPWSASFDL